MAEIHPNSAGLSGEYFVAAELYRRGFSVGMTIGNAKAVDIFAEKGDKIYPVQVKTIFKKQNVGWPMMKNKIKHGVLYVFVNLNGDKMIPPEYFICTSKEAMNKIKQYTTRGIINVNSLRSEKYIDRWDKIGKSSRVLRRAS